MKKIFSTLAVAAMMVVMASCGGKADKAAEAEGEGTPKTTAEQAVAIFEEAKAKLANATPQEAYKISDEVQAKMDELEEANPDFKPSEEESAKMFEAMQAFQEAFNKATY